MQIVKLLQAFVLKTNSSYFLKKFVLDYSETHLILIRRLYEFDVDIYIRVIY